MSEPSFRDYLIKEYSLRSSRNPNYSLRAFARDLGMSHQRLSKIFAGKLAISLKSANEIVSKMNWSKKEKEIFICLVTAKHHRSEVIRQQAERRLKELLKIEPLVEVNQIDAEILEDPVTQAVYYFVDTEHFESNYQYVARKMDISVFRVQRIIEVLLRFGFLKETPGKQWKRAKGNIKVSFKQSSPAVKKIYEDALLRAKKCLHKLNEDERLFSLTYLLINNEDIPFIKQELEDFRKKLIEKLTRMGESSTRIYGLGIQVFPFDQSGLGSHEN